MGDLENPGQLPVHEVLEATDDCVLYIFEIFSLFMFSRVGNPFLIFLPSYHVSVILKIQVNFRYRMYLNVLMIVSHNFFQIFFTIYVFEGEESFSDISTELPCFSELENSGQLPVQEVLMILSYNFLKFLHYLCFRGHGIHF